ncbi:hypothetical protein [Streptomyces sp. bgisy031]|uniref:hypothetical protein n=1 Tax=Streptomyces sp. bgisy031 TaxID=3413772 RepID=UPI003D7356A9
MDEPMSAPAPDAEQRAFDQVLGLAGPDRIIVLIRPRMVAVRRVARILVLDEGPPGEEGSHAELFAAEPVGRCAQMYRLQADRYEHDRSARLPGPARPPPPSPRGLRAACPPRRSRHWVSGSPRFRRRCATASQGSPCVGPR